MPNQIDGNKKEARSKELIALSDGNEKRYNETYVGKTIEVLFEDEHIENGKTFVKGHTTNYIVVKVEKKKRADIENTIQKVEIIGTEGMELIGKIV